jgi:hypothetical protein
MFIPDVINTLLMGLIFMVVIVTVVRPFVLNMVGEVTPTNDMQKAAIAAVEREMIRNGEWLEAQRANKIKYQMLLLETPEKPKPKPVPAPAPVMETQPQAMQEVATAEHAVESDGAEASTETELVDGAQERVNEESEDTLAPGEIEIREGESLAEIKERIRKEQQKAKKPTIPPELLNSANSYEDKVGVVRMVVQTDQGRVASVIRGMIQTK